MASRAVNVNAVHDMRLQIVAAGLFNVLMYFIAALALTQLWRAVRPRPRPARAKHLWGTALVGFGVWHIADIILSHWVTGIHASRSTPLIPCCGIWPGSSFSGCSPPSLDRPGAPTKGGGGAAAALGLSALIAGPMAAWPAASEPTQIVVLFALGVSSAQAFDALARSTPGLSGQTIPAGHGRSARKTRTGPWN